MLEQFSDTLPSCTNTGTNARIERDDPVPLSSRALLTAREILELDAALIEAYRRLGELRVEMPAARRIARPPIPAVLSESLVSYSARWLFGDACVAAYGGREADLLVRRPVGDPILVEVKATGSSKFQEVKPCDFQADVLVWVAFGNRYVDGLGPTTVYVLTEPSRSTEPSGTRQQ